MAPHDKAQYLGYHAAFDCEEGFDVPMSAFEKQHHRARHRPATKPGAHGGEHLTRHHLKPRLLARSHSWPEGEDADAEEWPLSEEGDREYRAPVPPATPSKRPAAVVKELPPLKVAGRQPPAVQVAGWAAVRDRLASDAPANTLGPQRWPRRSRPGSSVADSDSIKGEAAVPGPGVARQCAGGAQHIEAADDRLMDRDVAKAAAQLLPALLEDGEGQISLGRMKLLLESAVSVAALRAGRVEAVCVPVVARPLRVGGDAGSMADAQAEEPYTAGRDLRGKGWTRRHKGARGAKKMEQVSFNSARRLAQFYDAIGYFSADEQQLGKSWTLYDKARSRQHGGDARFKRATSDHHD